MTEYSEALDRQMELTHYYLSDEGLQLLRDFFDAEMQKRGVGDDMGLANRKEHARFGEKLITRYSDLWQLQMAAGLAGGECFYWARPMLDLVYTASQTIPEAWTLMPNALPAPCGFFWFAKPVYMGETKLRALSWLPRVRERGGTFLYLVPPYKELPTFTPGDDSVEVLFYMEGTDDERIWPPFPLSALSFPFGYSIKEKEERASSDGSWSTKPELLRHKTRLFTSMVAFLQQRILVSSRRWPSRATRRRAEKEGRAESTINVIRLRKTIARPHKGEHELVEWTCQWIVSGHWRDQWYPSIRRNQPIWIAPYIKGPEDKPLRNPGRLFAVVR